MPKESSKPLLPSDAVRPFGKYRDFIIQHYRCDDVDAIVDEYGILCSESEQRILFPFRYRENRDHQIYGDWPMCTVAVWGRAVGAYTREEGPGYRYWIRPEDARPLYIPKFVAFDVVLVTEGAMDAIKLQHYLPWVQACGSYRGELSRECTSVMWQYFGRSAKYRIVYDAGSYRQASENARMMRERNFTDVEAMPFPHEDPGSSTPEQLRQWYDTSF